MDNETRIESLKESFGILKDSANSGDISPLEKLCSHVLAPMISLDTPLAVGMWEYLIRRYGT